MYLPCHRAHLLDATVMLTHPHTHTHIHTDTHLQTQTLTDTHTRLPPPLAQVTGASVSVLCIASPGDVVPKLLAARLAGTGIASFVLDPM